MLSVTGHAVDKVVKEKLSQTLRAESLMPY